MENCGVRAAALGLCAVLLMGVTGACGTSSDESQSMPVVQNTPTEVLVTGELSEYENGEVLVEYDDGTYQVLTYSDLDSLEQGLKDLAEDENVTLIQPNYAYESSDFSTSDALAAQQWALHNDGTFYMEQQQNRFPVFDEPFGRPSAPGQWTQPKGPDRSGTPMNRLSGLAYRAAAAQQTTAVAGIDINAQEAWEIYDGGSRDVVVALIDTGVDYSHEDLSGSIWVNENEIADNGIDDDGNGYVDDVQGWNFYGNSNQVYTGSEDSHGTHGAGTIIAAGDNQVGIAGVVQSENVKVMSLKVLGGSDGSGSTASIIKAIQYAEDNGASICNLSLGSSQDDRALYQAMANSGMLFVVAAGNDGADEDISPSYPAAYALDNIISVANLNCDGTLHYSSNYGADSVDLAAPGTYILSTTPEDSYSYMTGTSMAAPMVTAGAAMVYSYYNNVTLADVKEILLSTAAELDSLNGLTLTGGMLDLGAAMSFELEDLSGDVWDTQTSDSSVGSAPNIAARLWAWQDQTYLVVQVTDTDGDLDVTAYAAATLSAAQFEGGSAGQTFELNQNSAAVFSVGKGGTYTFYAKDSAGNETVQTVTVSKTGKSVVSSQKT